MDRRNEKIGVNHKILAVDDSQSYLNVLFEILNKENYLVTLANGGKEALKLLSENDYDLVLLDVEMPDINGFDVCRFMREDEQLKEIPIIFVTSYGQIENKIVGFGIGAQDFITKPFNKHELIGRVKTHLLLKHKSDLIKNIHQALEEKNRSIIQSIEYAKYIQLALLPSLEEMDKFLKDYFILFKAKEIIGGDFYWIKTFESRIYIAVADCTGHGIPGALLSVFAISALNELIGTNQESKPSKLLDDIRDKIIGSFKKKDSLFNNDGLDIAMCMIDKKKMKIEYSGANIPLFIFKSVKSRSSYELIKRTADKMPIGNYPGIPKNFTNHALDIRKGDRIYIFTDGYASQFGGTLNKTYRTKNLVTLLLNNQNISISEQKELLEKNLKEWKGNNTQVDDILVLGIEI